MRRFIALVQEPAAAEAEALREFFTAQGWGYWHWIEGAWLLTLTPGQVEQLPEKNAPAFLRDKLGEVAKGKHCLIFDADNPKSWAGFGPNGEQRNMFKWYKENWAT